MITIKLNKYNCIEDYKYKTINAKLFEKLFCDSEFIISLDINDVITDIDKFKMQFKDREKRALTDRKFRMMDVRSYLQNNKEATKRCNIELDNIVKRLSKFE